MPNGKTVFQVAMPMPSCAWELDNQASDSVKAVFRKVTSAFPRKVSQYDSILFASYTIETQSFIPPTSSLYSPGTPGLTSTASCFKQTVKS